MFRVKIQVPKELVSQYVERIKTGVRGVGYVKVNDSAVWPARLQNLVVRPAARPRWSSDAGASPWCHPPPPQLRRRRRRAGRLHRGRHPPLRQGRRARRHLARHPERHHGRHRRPRRRRQVDADGADRRLQEAAAGQGDRPRRRHRRRPAPARRGPAHRVHAAGPGQEPLSRAQRPRQRRLHGAALRAVGRGAPDARQGAARRHRARPVSPTVRPASSRAA